MRKTCPKHGQHLLVAQVQKGIATGMLPFFFSCPSLLPICAELIDPAAVTSAAAAEDDDDGDDVGDADNDNDNKDNDDGSFTGINSIHKIPVWTKERDLQEPLGYSAPV
ncbi:hypothetical protein STEG23_009449 [Scotinomys teguina]